MIHRLTGSLAAALMTVGLAACGGAYSSVAMSGSPGVDQSPAAYDAPGRIVSISTVATELLFAIGAGERVVAVDAQSNYPAEVPITDLNSFEPNVEAILGFQPRPRRPLLRPG